MTYSPNALARNMILDYNLVGGVEMLRLKEIREAAGYSNQQEIANVCEVSQGAVSHWENGKTNPDLKTFLVLCEFLHVTPNQMLGYDEVKMEQVRYAQEQSEEPGAFIRFEDGTREPLSPAEEAALMRTLIRARREPAIVAPPADKRGEIA